MSLELLYLSHDVRTYPTHERSKAVDVVDLCPNMHVEVEQLNTLDLLWFTHVTLLHCTDSSHSSRCRLPTASLRWPRPLRRRACLHDANRGLFSVPRWVPRALKLDSCLHTYLRWNQLHLLELRNMVARLHISLGDPSNESKLSLRASREQIRFRLLLTLSKV